MCKFHQVISDCGVLTLDGGIATELESLGHSLDSELWSARLLQDAPDDVARVHRDYLNAGADIITSLSYQATVGGFMRIGCSEPQAKDLIQASVRLAKSAIEERAGNQSETSASSSRPKPMVAASVGSYGAYLAGGEEYVGNYGVTISELVGFHETRWGLLAEAGPDVMLCETIPSFCELNAIIQVAENWQDSRSREAGCLPVIVSFSCRDSGHIADGTPIEECAKRIEDSHLDGMGVNCLPPSWVDDLIERIRTSLSKSLMVYPNSGERYDALTKRWTGHRDALDFELSTGRWIALGASIVGGCCRTTPQSIRAISRVCREH